MTPPGLDQAFAAAVQAHSSGDLDTAEARYRAILRDVPTYPGALCNLGALLAQKGDPAGAENCYLMALAGTPGFADAHFNLGNLYHRGGNLRAALTQFRACVQANSNHANGYFNLGTVASKVGDLLSAEAAFRAVTQMEPQVGQAHLRLGDVLLRLGRIQDGLVEFQRYSAAYPADPRGLYNLALALANDAKPADAQEALHKALKLKPDYAEAHNALGLALEMLGRKDDALFHYLKAVELKPDLADAWSNMGTNLVEQSRTAEATDCYRKSLAARPDAPAIHGNLLLTLNYDSRLSPEQVRDEHLAWAARFASPVQPPPVPHLPHDPERKLRIGYVSADFRDHTVAGFIEALLTHHDRDRFEVFAFPNVPRPDATTEKLKGLADHWKPIFGVTEDEAATRIEADKIDVLVDLGGHTAGNRLLTFAYHPAAVQATVFGYPNTTGVGAMDFRITDAISDPPGMTEAFYTETLLRLPDLPWVYRPPAEASAVTPLPAASRKGFTFGCLNNAAKISDACVDAWTKLIQGAPGSKLVLLAGQSPSALKKLADRFARAGILRERIELINRLPRDQYFERYSTFDLALDPFPYNGGVTTCDALWMGVPVLTVAGTNYVSRQGVLQMTRVGLPEFVAESADALPALGKLWMGKRDELAAIRAGLRDRLSASPLCDATKYVRNLEAALRAEWAERLPRG
jgi:predicted O-linked N-acetylglucosamine transferase (SPINDLY family)